MKFKFINIGSKDANFAKECKIELYFDACKNLKINV